MADEKKRRPVVLLVEDEGPLAGAVCDNLEDDFEFEVAGNADEALLLLGTRQFDAIVSDQMMPGKKQGLDFLVEAMERQPNAKRILITGYVNPDLLVRSVPLANLSACLMKPMSMAELRQALHTALGLSA
ncbi:MAG: response regulator [Opitutae bacterium]|nr:response regulator [Opitutae bacterium]